MIVERLPGRGSLDPLHQEIAREQAAVDQYPAPPLTPGAETRGDPVLGQGIEDAVNFRFISEGSKRWLMNSVASERL
jgi:hypothetical protein